MNIPGGLITSGPMLPFIPFRAGAFLGVLVLGVLVSACGSKKSGLTTPPELPAGTRHHALSQTQLGIYAVFLPPDYAAKENSDKTYPLVVIIHGHGSTEIRHGKLADVFGREDVIYLAPRAPYPHPEVFIYDKTPGWTAWPSVPESLYEIDEQHEDYIDVDVLYTRWIADTVQDVRRRYRVNDHRVTVYGHSQGAAFAHLFALHHPELVKAYFSFAGFYGQTTDEPTPDAARILKENQIFPYLAHNRPDPMVGAVQSERLVAYFKEHGVKHSAYISESGDHYLTPEGRAKAVRFVRDWCCGEHSSERRRLPKEPAEPVSQDPSSTASPPAPRI